MRNFMILISLTSFAFGCRLLRPSDHDEAPAPGSSPSSPFLTTGELAPGSGIKALSRTDAKKSIETENHFMDDDPTSASNCVAEILKNLTLTATANRLEAGTDTDATSCAKDLLGVAYSGKISSANLHVATALTCDGADLSGYNGKSMKSMPVHDNLCKNGSVSTQFLNMKLTINFAWESGGKSYTGQFLSITSTAAGDEASCKFTVQSGNLSSQDCTHIERAYWPAMKVNGKSADGENDEDYKKFIYKNLVSASGTSNKWYQSGSMDVVLNDWTGTVTYKDVATAPTYVLKDSEESISGTIGDSGTSLGLENVDKTVDTMQRVVARGFQNFK